MLLEQLRVYRGAEQGGPTIWLELRRAMGYLLDFVRNHLQSKGVEVQAHPEKPTLRFTCSGVVDWACFVSERNARELLCYGVLPANIPQEHRPAVAEFITRANYGMAVGNFELDYSDGEVRYKTYVALDEGPMTDGLLGPLLATNHAMMRKYTPGFIRVIDGIAPARAVAEVESQNPTAGFFLDGFERARLELDDVHGLHGGRRLIVHGDGRAEVETIPAGRHGQGKVNASALFELVVQNDLLGFVNPPRRPIVPDEACPQIKLVNAGGEERVRGVWSNDDVPPFRRVYQALLELEKQLLP